MLRKSKHAEHVARGSKIEAQRWNQANEGRGGEEQRRATAQVGPGHDDARTRERTACEIIEAANHDDDAGEERKCAGIDARRRPADAVVETADCDYKTEASGEDGSQDFKHASRYHRSIRPDIVWRGDCSLASVPSLDQPALLGCDLLEVFEVLPDEIVEVRACQERIDLRGLLDIVLPIRRRLHLLHEIDIEGGLIGTNLA